MHGPTELSEDGGSDYGGGRSLLCAAERGICLIARPRSDRVVRVTDVVSHTRAEALLDPNPVAASGDWALYVAAVARRLARNFPEARRGADIAFGSDLPMAAGMSSSSALVTSMLLALSRVNDLPATVTYRANIASREDLAEYLGTIENGQDFRALAGDAGVGTFGGSEDHTAILCCRPGELRQYSFCPIRHERTVALPSDLVLTIGVSGVIAMKTGAAQAKYNRAALAARKVLETWRAATGRSDPTIAAAIAHAPDAPDRMRAVLRASKDKEFPSRLLCNRFEQFLEESTAIIPSAADALAAGDLVRFGSLVDRSQQGAETLLRNQVPETIALARSARALGAIAASAFGAGFGGSVWALVLAAKAAEFTRRWESSFQDQFPGSERACFLSTRPGPAAFRL